ncbi:hypothetical protein SETIT_8G223900v2 [Setaria italica]|uniref:Uncharacterized protein n=1 Tax=Setaria italica TaxID=4555 RepID=A0A368SAH4_SETIT|nr:hypothetical protein SETIT_8G223900v2 [Setaria italica]
MARIVHYLMAVSFVALVMISSNSPSCQACFPPGPWCRPRPPCFQPANNYCTSGPNCAYTCQLKGHTTYNAYCKPPKRSDNPKVYLCCCPP